MRESLVRPCDRISHARKRLTFLATLIASASDTDSETVVDFSHPENQDGLYYTLNSIADDIDSALGELQNKEVSA